MVAKGNLFSENIFNPEITTGFNSNILQDNKDKISSFYNKVSLLDNYNFQKIPLEFTLLIDCSKYYKKNSDIYINLDLLYKFTPNLGFNTGYIFLKDNNDNTNSFSGAYGAINFKFNNFNFIYKLEYDYFIETYQYDKYVIFNFKRNYINTHFAENNTDYKRMHFGLDKLFEKKHEKDLIHTFSIEYPFKNITISTSFELNNSNIIYERYENVNFSLEYYLEKNYFNIDFSTITGYYNYFRSSRREFTFSSKLAISYFVFQNAYIAVDFETQRVSSNIAEKSFTQYISSLTFGITF